LCLRFSFGIKHTENLHRNLFPCDAYPDSIVPCLPRTSGRVFAVLSGCKLLVLVEIGIAVGIEIQIGMGMGIGIDRTAFQKLEKVSTARETTQSR
jgi:hypothetical protein